MAWHPTEDVLLSCSYDNTIKVRPRTTGQGGMVYRYASTSSS